MSYLSRAALEQLSRPWVIRYSFLSLLLKTALMAGAAAGFFVAAFSMFMKTAPGASPEPSLWAFLGLGCLCLLAVIRGALPIWLAIGQPALTISREGLAFRGKPLIPWSEIESNNWSSMTYLGITMSSGLVVKAAGRKIRVDSGFFKCSGEEYLHYCELYEAASKAV